MMNFATCGKRKQPFQQTLNMISLNEIGTTQLDLAS